MTNQQDLRERIAEVIDREYGSFTCSMTNTEARALAFEVTDLLLPLLSPSDTRELMEPGQSIARECFNAGYSYGIEDEASPEEYDAAWNMYLESGRAADALLALTTGGWRSIDSAPRDGSRVLLFVPPYGPSTGHYEPSRSNWGPNASLWVAHSVLNKEAGPTHWMPLPEPPTSKPDTGE